MSIEINMNMSTYKIHTKTFKDLGHKFKNSSIQKCQGILYIDVFKKTTAFCIFPQYNWLVQGTGLTSRFSKFCFTVTAT